MRNTRIILFMVTVILINIGIVMIYSASSIYALEKLGDSTYFLRRQLLFIFLGFILAILVMYWDYSVYRKFAKISILISLLLLVLVNIPGIGREVGGARRWFRLFGFSFQPSEFVFLSLILYMADFVSRNKARLRDLFFGFFPPMLILGAFCLLILIQPDLGSSVALGIVGMIILFMAGVNPKHLGAILLSAVPLLYLVVFNVPYRRARIMTFLNPWVDPRGSGFQIIQSQIALGSGGLLGKGLGKSVQKLFYLPAAHTDFIFSIAGEELGLIGTASIVILFIIFLWLGFKIVTNARDNFGRFLALGIVSGIGLKAVINIGVSAGFFPTKGLPLPFISYGGSSLIFDMLAVGLLLNISRSSCPD
ncbi:MAG: putative lipid II flippase FtsW [Candidatus Omnitrophota bacterium]